MRTIEYLVSLYPEKTGTELLAIQRAEKFEEEKEYQKQFSEDLDYIIDINKNGGYYIGTFGVDQHYMYSFSNLSLDNKGRICGDVKKLVLFNNPKDICRFTCKIEDEYVMDIDKYGLGLTKRVTKPDWDEITDYFVKGADLWYRFINKK